MDQAHTNPTPPKRQVGDTIDTAKQKGGYMLCLAVAFGYWVTVMNPGGIQSENRTIPFWEQCVIDQIQLTEPVRAYDESLMLYRVTDPQVAGGSRCPQGTLFLMEPSKWEDRKQGNLEWQERRRKDQDKMEQLLKQR